MKKIYLSCVLALFSAGTFAQNSVTNVIKLGSSGLAFEHALSDHLSVELAVPIVFAAAYSGGSSATAFGIGLGTELRFYLSSSKNAPTGLYAGPGISYLTGSAHSDAGAGSIDKSTFYLANAKAIMGYQWVWGSGFALDLNGGVGYSSFKYKSTDPNYNGMKFNSIVPELGVSIGYGF